MATTDTQWDYLADQVRCSIAAGKTMPLDDVFLIEKTNEIKHYLRIPGTA